MFILHPATFVDLSGEFDYILLSRLAFGIYFFVMEIVQKTLNLLEVNIRWKFLNDVSAVGSMVMLNTLVRLR